MMDPEPDEARVVPTGVAIDGDEALYTGTLEGARQFVATLSPDEQDAISIWTPEQVWTAAELVAEKRD